MRFRLLGPLEVRTVDGTPADPGGPKPRALLTLLLSEAGRVVSVDRVMAALWGDNPPPGATGTVQSYVSQLRRLLGKNLIVTRSPGYLADVDPADIDLLRLPALLDEAAELDPAHRPTPPRPDDLHAAAKLLTEAVDLWRGEPLADLPDDPQVVAARSRLAELHLLARHRRAACWIELGRTAEAITELEGLVAEHPLREELWAELIKALYRAGRQADALNAYRRCAQILADELGIDPSPNLRALETAVLRQDRAMSERATNEHFLSERATHDKVPSERARSAAGEHSLSERTADDLDMSSNATTARMAVERSLSERATSDNAAHNSAANERSTSERATSDNIAHDSAASERSVSERATSDNAAYHGAASERSMGEHAASDNAAHNNAASERSVGERATSDNIAHNRAASERSVGERATSDNIAHNRAASERSVGERTTSDNIAHNPAASERSASERATSGRLIGERALVGRRAEQSRLRAALGEVTRGSGAVIVLEGEAGIGKTRLAEAAAAMAGAQGWRSVWSRCADDAGVPALWPWLQVLERLDGGGLHGAADGDPTFALFDELRRRLAGAASATPLLIVLDDVQAADATSLALLALLARHLEGVRLLVVLTVRTVGEELPGEVVDCLAALAREPRAQRIQLTGLTPGDVRELIGGSDELARIVHERTDGNPFFAGELTALVEAEGRVDGLPPSVRDVLDRRLARLPAETVALLRLAAVIGRDADLPLLETASGLDAEQVITELEPAVASRVLRFDETAWRWRFSHALVQETLLAGLSRIAAARLHARVAQALSGAAAVDRLAHHYFQAVPVTGAEPARRYAIEAAAAARDQHAHAEAATQTRRALALLGPDDTERHRLLVALGDDLLRAGRLNEAQEVVAEAIAVARRLGDRDKLAAAASVWGGVTLWNWRAYGVVDESLVALLEELAESAGEQDPALRARLLGTLGVELAYSATRRADSVASAERAVEVARSLNDPALLGRTLNNYMIATWGSADRNARWLEAVEESLALNGLPLRTEFFARLHRGPLLLHLGDAAGFEADLAAATRLAARLTGPDVRPHLLYQETGRAMLRGRWAEGEESADQAYAQFRQTSLWGARFCRILHVFTFRGRDGRLGDALAELVDGAEEMNVPLLHGTAVVAAAKSGNLTEARRLRRRWPDVVPRDWTTDAVLVVQAWISLALGGDLSAAYESLLPYRGRQIVVGTAGACWGSYDLELARLATALGRDAEAAAHRDAAAALGEAVGSPWQVKEARGQETKRERASKGAQGQASKEARGQET
ncbi:BTAD domain-containing putative transcriptional regulator [Actinoplanes sp. Pm04-4]|uniref:BTAD domain-containing putative transcriptional regulator n=1 Tax=Paractinoplanes pyxinae TaxID=2997416 RepID=A0ABT4B3G9_9ACTN|nr:BTAD domain-containing putative transcriptional regulator [Actinoplanes pyxinae]MCY1141047.1 BTAD domain-containing putative transcriptional regulator [Actinoplanes pyxinae]